ncbi:hypothetical protein [Phormidesmis sp. 146-35]
MRSVKLEVQSKVNSANPGRRTESTERQGNRSNSLLPQQKPHTECPGQDHCTLID